jgi:tetratricopeptide (TPR) repeat protein
MTRSALVALALVLATRVARTDPSAQAKADMFFEKGQVHYDKGEYQAAIALFKDAYELVHDPVYLFNIAQSYRKVADCVEATDYYSKYLDALPTAANRAKVEGWVRELSPCVEQRRKEQDAAKRLEEIDRARRADAERKRQLAAPTEIDRGGALRVAGLATAGAGAVGIAIGIGYSIRGANLKNRVANDCATSCVWDQEKSLDAAGRHANTIATASYIAGGVVALTGAGLFVWGRVRVETVTVAPAVGGASVGATMRF